MSTADAKSSSKRARLHVAVRGAVQGVGFRPFVYRLAQQLDLNGWVNNSPQGVAIEVEGPQRRLDEFLLRLGREAPPPASIQSLEPTQLEAKGLDSFRILPSDESGTATAFVLPDIATCAPCRAEIFDPTNRRYHYPFTNCTHCGPRYSIIAALPYDRGNTTMRSFAMCPACRAEYDDPADRRFHAQPNACPTCGPQLALWDRDGQIKKRHHAALEATAAALMQGAIVAIKGLGGFQLMADAGDEKAVATLRRRKNREEKPFALMYPCLEQVERDCCVSPLEARLLTAPESPIVLLRSRTARLAPNVAPDNPYLGIMLPYTPLHHLLLEAVGRPLVATSGNLSDEPLCTDENDALACLGRIADLFLVHDRPILRQVDDSIARLVAGRQMLLRRARGFAPLPFKLPASVPPSLAVGAHLKNSVAVAVADQAFVSQHIGDLETEKAYRAFLNISADLSDLYGCRPQKLACDLHPDYLSTRYADAAGLPTVAVQHHYAHVLACMAENQIQAPVLGIAWDGSGYGPDHSVWGGEFLRVDTSGYQRVAHLRPFNLPGGDLAVRQPRRSAMGLLYSMWGDDAFADHGLPPLAAFEKKALPLLHRALKRQLNAPQTTSAGRLFDAVAALVGLRQESRFEGQAAMQLEFSVDARHHEAYPMDLDTDGVLDWRPMIEALIADLSRQTSTGHIAARFHNGLAKGCLAVAKWQGLERVALSGGCFQNKYLVEQTISRLREAGFSPFWHQRLPPNDGGIALGQLVELARIHAQEGEQDVSGYTR
jgi:hydrogenase maturation protein HypF